MIMTGVRGGPDPEIVDTTMFPMTIRDQASEAQP